MRIALTSTGNTMDSQLDLRFGRAAAFIIVDTETMNFEAMANTGVTAAGGAGVSSAQFMADKDVKAVVTGNVGPNAMNILRAADIDIYRGSAVSVAENVDKFIKGELVKIETMVPSHFGMGGGQGGPSVGQGGRRGGGSGGRR